MEPTASRTCSAKFATHRREPEATSVKTCSNLGLGSSPGRKGVRHEWHCRWASAPQRLVMTVIKGIHISRIGTGDPAVPAPGIAAIVRRPAPESTPRKGLGCTWLGGASVWNLRCQPQVPGHPRPISMPLSTVKPYLTPASGDRRPRQCHSYLTPFPNGILRGASRWDVQAFRTAPLPSGKEHLGCYPRLNQAGKSGGFHLAFICQPIEYERVRRMRRVVPGDGPGVQAPHG